MSKTPNQRRKFCFFPATNQQEQQEQQQPERPSLARLAQQRSCFCSAPHVSSRPCSTAAAQWQPDATNSARRDGSARRDAESGEASGGSRSCCERGGGSCCASSSSVKAEAARPGSSTTSRFSYHARNEVSKVTSSPGAPHSERCQQQQLQQLADEACSSGDSAKINCKLNEIFIKRLQEIERSTEGDADVSNHQLKLVTYQEWIDMLLKINETVIGNMQELESEVSQRLEALQRKASGRPGNGDDLSKSRKDINTLLKVIQNGYHHNNWSIEDLRFETLAREDVFGSPDCKAEGADGGGSRRNSADPEAAQKIKLLANVRALAVEVAEKHDAVCELKAQIVCLEEEIQNAQKKIQLKDDVIRELRNDLKCANAKLAEKASSSSTLTGVAMPPVNFELQSPARSAATQVSEGFLSQHQLLQSSLCNDDSSQYESLTQTEQVEQRKLKVLEEELNELFEMTNDLKKQNYELHRKRLSDIFQRSESEKVEAYRKLDFLRRQLADLEAKPGAPGATFWGDCDSGFSSRSESDKDMKIVEGVRKRILKLNESTFELNKKLQQLEIENNELTSKLHTEKTFVDRNSEILKQVADLLCDMTGEHFSYSEIYNGPPLHNPFCEVIKKLEATRVRREDQLRKKIAQMEESLFNTEREMGEFEQRISKPEMAKSAVITSIVTTTTETSTLQKDTQLHQTQQQQQQQHVGHATRERQP